MEFHIRPFLNRWPDKTLDRMRGWVEDENYHVRRLVSEGTRPRLPWGRNIALDPLVPLEFLDRLHNDPTRYVTRSVANHLNDLTRRHPDAVIQRLTGWRAQGRQATGEMHWITRHALRTAVKRGEPEALALLGYHAPDGLRVDLGLETPRVAIGGRLEFHVQVTAPRDMAVLVDYRVHFARPNGKPAFKVFKLGKARLAAGVPVVMAQVACAQAGCDHPALACRAASPRGSGQRTGLRGGCLRRAGLSGAVHSPGVHRASRASSAAMRSSVLGWLMSQAGAAPERALVRSSSLWNSDFCGPTPIPDLVRSAAA